ncbi:uncharacterized protein DSM5745_09948 [Aspergillus mulundensis]|uniref:Uncharacterized protein n=1 Tax=Aspergillus mulundensis TaxID=1810919 RepID=A0A3D8QRY1_9EURO|nr:hypothetical protein DSM5745_09948 [Aspergillus mulundensis]RDW64537.1 hypothetical protein DSM5745_09948 [Aspergillus mulundensis]
MPCSRAPPPQTSTQGPAVIACSGCENLTCGKTDDDHLHLPNGLDLTVAILDAAEAAGVFHAVHSSSPNLRRDKRPHCPRWIWL